MGETAVETFLCSDVEGSTSLTTRRGDEAAREPLGRVRGIHREETARHEGREVDAVGDGFLAAFASPRQAIRAALQIQRRLAADRLPAVRIGLNAGEVSRSDGRPFGAAINAAARVAACAHGRQVLVTDSLRQLAGTVQGAHYRDRGRFVLKGFPERWRLYEVVLDEPLPAQPPPDVQPKPGRGRTTLTVAAIAILTAGAALLVLLLADRSGPNAVTAPANSVAVVDPTRGRLVAQIPVGSRPGPLAVTSDSVWVANLDDDTVTRIDRATHGTLHTFSPGGLTTGVAPAGESVWVADPISGVAKRVDPTLGVVAHTARPGRIDGPPQSADVQEPVAVGAGSLWVGHSGVVTRLDPTGTTRLATITVGDESNAIAVGEGATWVSDAVDNEVVRIIGDRVAGRTPVGDGPGGLAVGAGGVWVAQSQAGTVTRIDPASGAIQAVIPVGDAPSGVAVIGDSVWVANSGEGTLSEIDARKNRVVNRLSVGNSPVALAAVSGRLWVSVQSRFADVSAPGREAAGGVARVDLRSPPDSLDPALAYSPTSWQILYATCAKLYNYPDRSGAAGARLVPEVATGMPSVSADGLRYTFTIRRGFRFSPSSNAPVTAQTFRHVIQRDVSRDLHGASPFAPAYFIDIAGIRAFEEGRARHIAGVTASGNLLTIRLTRPSPNLAARLSTPPFCALPDDAPARSSGIDNLPMAGPYYIRSAIRGRQIVLARNPNYHGPRTARPDAIDIRIGATPTTAISRVAAGKDDYYTADVLNGQAISPIQTADLERRYGAAHGLARQRFFVNQSYWVNYFVLNTTRPLFAGDRLRRAVNFAIDRKALAAHSGLFAPYRPTDQYLAPGMIGFRDVTLYPDRPDVARARRLAGRGHRHANLLVCNIAPCPQWAAVIRANLAKIGISVTPQEVSFAQLASRRAAPHASWDLSYLPWAPDFPDPYGVLNALLRGAQPPFPGSYNTSHFDDPVYNRRLDDAAGLSGPARSAAYARLDADLAGRAAPMVAFGVPLIRDFLSARMGCQVFQPEYGMDLAALCIKHH